MARRKEFKAIANGLIGSFVSRNNDVYGYWGIGKLYSHMISSGSMQLQIDLIHKIIEPQNEEFKLLIDEFANRLMTQVLKRKLNPEFLKTAKLTMTGFPEEPTIYFGRMAPNKVSCRLVIIDDLNKEHISEAITWCKKHNPNKESKSGRYYPLATRK